MILVRHGQSEFNVVYGETGRDPGIEDPALTALGRRQAGDAAAALAAAGIRCLLASPYTRALQTAGIIADLLGLPVRVEPLVRERRAFICDIGRPRRHLSDAWPDLDFDHLDEVWWPGAEESEAELLGRCDRFRSHAAGLEDWRETAVVSHWGFILGLTGEAVGNCDLVRFDPAATVAAPGDP